MDRSDPNFKSLSLKCREEVEKDQEEFASSRFLSAANQGRQGPEKGGKGHSRIQVLHPLPQISDDRRKNHFKDKDRAGDPAVLPETIQLGWAGHVARRTDNWWATLTQEWIPRDTKRPVGRLPMRWIDALDKEVTIRQGNRVVPWSTIAKDRKAWCAVIRAHTT
ncbi:unnamed protein product [Caenorhabditis sp. 36 PRJEB53466]|nr:unnamed protein product [Caenorhabditis sp. 36 PRJEB53466]